MKVSFRQRVVPFCAIMAMTIVAIFMGSPVYASGLEPNSSGPPNNIPGGPPTFGYQLSVIATGLEFPTGIDVDAAGNLYFTQLPTPGVSGDMGGSNKVSRRDSVTGEITNITIGEPEPTFIDITRHGELYWTCKSAGVILQYVAGETTLVADMLEFPSGLAVQDRGSDKGTIYLSQLPTPGVSGDMGGENTVSSLKDGELTTLTLGEPEPTEIAVDRHGNLYWTCKSAGVILTRHGATGNVVLLLDGLAQPSGIALDETGNLYFTEVPTPGVPGNEGGMNKVWKYNLSAGVLTLIHQGDPEPTDVAVSASGQNVYWTCTSAGVIVRASLAPIPDVSDNNGDTVMELLEALEDLFPRRR